jgi:ubiquinone/menaquinone biosynthesis C-methylase UbiE
MNASATIDPPVVDAEQRLAAVSNEFDYKNRCRHSRGKLWHESYDAAIAPYASFSTHKLERIRVLARPGRRLLDIGCGLGDVIHLLRSSYEAFDGLDPSPDMVDAATRNLRDRGVENVRISQGLAESLPYEDGTFDTIVTTDTYEHIDPAFRASALSEMRRVLVPGGQMILVTPSRRHIRAFALLDNLLTIPAQRRAGKVTVFGLPAKAYTEVFCTRRELIGEIRRAGFEVTRFERTSFYPAPERPGALGAACRWMYARAPRGVEVCTGVQRAVQRLRILNQKMLVEARA